MIEKNMVGIKNTRKAFISLISIVVPNGTAPTQMFQKSVPSTTSRKQLISLPESKTIKRKNPKIAPKFPIKEKKP